MSVITGETHGPFSIVDDSLVILTIGENWDGRWVETRGGASFSVLISDIPHYVVLLSLRVHMHYA